MWEIFDKLAGRHLADGLTDAETLAGIRKHMRALPTTFWPAETDTEALTRIAHIRLVTPPARERTDAEASAALDEAMRRVVTSAFPVVPPIVASTPTSGPPPMTDRATVEGARQELVDDR